MEKADFLQKRKGKYMAQILEKFEQTIEPHLPDTAAEAAKDFKGLVRGRLHAFQTDAVEVIELRDGAINGFAQEIRDRMSPVGRP